MGHMALISYESIIVPMEPTVMTYLLIGGLLYVVGVLFYVWDSVQRIPVLHVIWHLFVLTAAIFHYFAVRQSVVHRVYESTHTIDAMELARQSSNFLNFEL